jgi:hypothetical protein
MQSRPQDRQVSHVKINELLNERHQRFTPLQRLLRQAGNQENWTAELHAVLPTALARECRVSDVRGSVIVITCRNASSATKLRFMARDILDTLGQLAAFSDARELQIRVTN